MLEREPSSSQTLHTSCRRLARLVLLQTVKSVLALWGFCGAPSPAEVIDDELSNPAEDSVWCKDWDRA